MALRQAVQASGLARALIRPQVSAPNVPSVSAVNRCRLGLSEDQSSL